MVAQSPVIIISGEQLSSYEYGLLQVPIFGALIIGNLVLARLTSRRTVRALIIMGGWPIAAGWFWRRSRQWCRPMRICG